jgi:hypothetical protein
LNGIVPKKFSDYAIPLRYAYPADAAGDGTLRGTTFPPISTIPPVATLSSTALIDYPLYLVSKGAAAYGLEYQWDTGTYYFPYGTSLPDAGTVNPTTVDGDILSLALSGDMSAADIIVNKASGLVLTDNGANSAMTVTHFANTTSQQWLFDLDSGGGNCGTYVAPSGPTAVACSNTGNTPNAPPNCGSLIYAASKAGIAYPLRYWNAPSAGQPAYANGGGGCADCNWTCGGPPCVNSGCGGGPYPTGTFFLQAYDSGGTRAIYNFAGSNGGAVEYLVTDPSQTLPANSVTVLGGGNVITGNANQLWAFIPFTNVDPSP